VPSHVSSRIHLPGAISLVEGNRCRSPGVHRDAVAPPAVANRLEAVRACAQLPPALLRRPCAHRTPGLCRLSPSPLEHPFPPAEVQGNSPEGQLLRGYPAGCSMSKSQVADAHPGKSHNLRLFLKTDAPAVRASDGHFLAEASLSPCAAAGLMGFSALFSGCFKSLPSSSSLF